MPSLPAFARLPQLTASDLGTQEALDSRYTGRYLLGMNPSIESPSPFFHWLSVNQIRKMQRMRRKTVICAMESGELPFERRGRIRYARLADVQAWEFAAPPASACVVWSYGLFWAKNEVCKWLLGH